MKQLTVMMVLAVLGSACGSAHYVRQDARSGEIEIEGAYMPSWREATTMMVTHCNGRYEVLEQDAKGNIVAYRCSDDRISLR